MAQGFHPERPERLVAARRGLDGSLTRQSPVASRLASTGELVRVHSADYIERLEALLRKGHGFLDGDTFFSPGTHEAAWRAAGTACALVETLLEPGGPSTGILLARPPGHHATRDRAMGFCVVNSVAVAAAHARARGTARVAIVDFDVHHGNGTQDIFESDPDVLFISLHQWPLYPGTGGAQEVGLGEARGRTVNLPLPPGSGAGAYRAAFERVVAPAIEAFAPGLLLVSAGFDAHERDPLAAMRVDTGTFGWMGGQLGA
ncbi:MAG: histone deacetylase, partial [Deltaproteobacteria bacterium]